MAYGPLAALIALQNAPKEQRDQLAKQYNDAMQKDIAAQGGNTAFTSSAATPNMNAVLYGSTGTTPQFNFQDLFPAPVNVGGVTGSAGLTPAALETGGSPVATGFELFRETYNMLLQAEELRQRGVDQQLRTGMLLTELGRASPTAAAELAVRTGLTDWEPNLNWANAFAEGAHTTFGGQIGSQNVSLPWSFSGSQLSFLRDRPNVERMLTDIGDFLGRPDILSESLAGLVPTNRGLISLAG